MENRNYNYDILKVIQERWSPRAFDPHKKVLREDLYALIEAARYAPSCFNEQPWRFLIAEDEERKALVIGALTPSNQEWAVHAPVLMVIAAVPTFSQSGKQNRWHQFDTGTAWGYLTLEAQKRGLITHAMGGFNVDVMRTNFNLPDDLSIMAVVAIGYMGSAERLSDKNKEKEKPNHRKPIGELLI